MIGRALFALVFLGIFASLLFIGLGVVAPELQSSVERAAVTRATTACNANLPGGNWTVLNRSVDLSRAVEPQELLCQRNGTVRPINVTIEVELHG